MKGVLHGWMMTHLTATTTDEATRGIDDRCYLTPCCTPVNMLNCTSKTKTKQKPSSCNFC